MKLLVLSGHPPNVDPRETWVVEGAARSGADVLYLCSTRQLRSSRTGNVKLVTVPPTRKGIFWPFRKVPRIYWKTFGLMMLVTLPLDLLYQLTARATRSLRSSLKPPLNRNSELEGSHSATTFQQRARSSVGAEDEYIASFLHRRVPLLRSLASIALLLRHDILAKHLAFCEYLDNSDFTPDVVHANDFGTALTAVWLKERYACRVIYDCQEYFPYSDDQFGVLERRIYSAIDCTYCKSVDTVVTVNPYLACRLESEYGISSAISVPNAGPISDLNSLVPRKRPSTPKRVEFLYQGSFAANRGLLQILEAWRDSSLRDRAVLLLRGPESPYRTELISLARTWGILGRSVHFLEKVDPSCLIAAASEADVGLIPYRPTHLNNKFACPNKLFEYMAAGLPVISNDLLYPRLLLSESGAGLIYSDNDSASLHRVLTRMCDLDVRTYHSDRAREFLKAGYNWEFLGARLEKVYSGVECGSGNFLGPISLAPRFSERSKRP